MKIMFDKATMTGGCSTIFPNPHEHYICHKHLNRRPPCGRRLSSTYRSFRREDDFEIHNGANIAVIRPTRRRLSLSPGELVDFSKISDFTDPPRKIRPRRSFRAEDGYLSDTPVSKPFLSTFKSDDRDFENALLVTLKEKSRSAQSLTDTNKKLSPFLKPVTVEVPVLSKRVVKFTEPMPIPKIIPSELPHTSFEQLRNQKDTLHPRLLYSTQRYPNLKLTVIFPTKRPLFRSQSDGDLSKSHGGKDDMRVAKMGGDGEVGKVAQLSGRTLSRALRVLSGSWRNLLQLGGMSRPQKSTPLAKKVAPPAVPEVFRHSGSSFGSAGYASSEDGFLPLPTPDAQSSVSSDGSSPGVTNTQFPYPSFTFPGKGVYYHPLNQQEDQGIDMTQSPGRDSPGSSGSGSGSRHSTASLDSGRASGSHLMVRGVAASNLVGGSSSPRCSISSIDHNRVDALIHQGISDQDVIHAWLKEMNFEEYFSLFVSAGYDMPTISKMTPEDLTAIGIKKPNHRKRLKAEIAQLSISDGLPDYIPGSMEEWLRLLRLEEYVPVLKAQNYHTIEDVTELAWEDLEEAGVVKLGHQKRLLLAIKRVKDIRAGKRINSTSSTSSSSVIHHVTQAELHTPSSYHYTPNHYEDDPDNDHESSFGATPIGNVHTLPRAHHHHHHYQQQQPQQQQFSSIWHNWPVYANRDSIYSTDIVPIQIRAGGRGKSLESLEDGDRSGNSTYHTFSPENTNTFYFQQQQQQQQQQQPIWRRCYDDGDITPTNENTSPSPSAHAHNMGLIEFQGGGTLPRPRGLVRPRPIAKIPAHSRNNNNNNSISSPSYFDNKSPSGVVKDFTSKSGNSKEEELIQHELFELQEKCPPSMPPISANVYDYAAKLQQRLGTPKRPPSPPKRLPSTTHPDEIDGSTNKTTTVVELHSLPPLPKFEDISQSMLMATSELEALHLAGGNLPPKSWTTGNSTDEEQQLIAQLANQQRNGSDASFKSSSSTESSDSLPFANENAGTIKQRARGVAPPPSTASVPSDPTDVLSDIGNMLANLTDELDAMLEEEKRQAILAEISFSSNSTSASQL